MTTRDKLTFVHAMARSTRATVRQCEALLRYAGTLAHLHNMAPVIAGEMHMGKPERQKRERIQRKVAKLCQEISRNVEAGQPLPMCTPVFAGPVLKIRTPDGREIEVPA